MDTPLTDETTAYHEAGHAVIGTWYGFEVGTVTVVPEGPWRGCCRWVGQNKGDPMHRVVMYLAGVIAEDEYTGRGWAVPGAIDDLSRTFRELRPIIQKHWISIEAVAGALLAKKTLTGGEVRSLIRLAERLAHGGLYRRRRASSA
jgi:Peptidase family M41